MPRLFETSRHVEYGGPSLEHLSAPGGRFTAFLAFHASNRERKGPQPRFRDVVSALDTAPVVARFQPRQRGIDSLNRFLFDLNERDLDVFLNIDIGDLSLVDDADCVWTCPFCSNQ